MFKLTSHRQLLKIDIKHDPQLSSDLLECFGYAEINKLVVPLDMLKSTKIGRSTPYFSQTTTLLLVRRLTVERSRRGDAILPGEVGRDLGGTSAQRCSKIPSGYLT